MYKILCLLTIFGIHVSLKGQSNSSREKPPSGFVGGNILDGKSGKPLPYANISLYVPGSSQQPVNVLSDKNGVFEFKKLPFGSYHLAIEMVGFVKLEMDSINLRPERNEFNLGDLLLKEAASQLNEVVVYSEKPLIENKDGKIAFNVSESPLSNGSNASEMLKNMPLLSANPDGTLLLRGKEPLILMDEKPLNVGGQQLTDLLESLPANVIDKVEIMQNPPPEYATYPGGVINIVTKKGRIGVFEKITASGGTRGEGNMYGNYSYRTGKLNIIANVGGGTGLSLGNSHSQRENFYTDSVNYINSQSAYHNRNWNSSARFQTDYDFNKRNSVSFVYQGNLSYINNNSMAFYSNLDSLQDVYKVSSRHNNFTGNGYNHGFSSSYQWKGINPVEKFQFFTGLNLSKNANNKDFYQQFLQPDYVPTGLDSTQLQVTDNYVTSYYANAYYNKPLNDTGTTLLSSGVTYSSSTYHNILNTSYLRNTDQVFVGNDLLSNNFYFHQSIVTARLTLIVALPLRWKLITGVQAEHTETDFRFVKGNAPDANNAYWRLLPNLTLRKDLNKSLNVSLTFRETIRRPGITELNPSVDYTDPFNIRFGNPYIQPSLADNFDFNIGYSERNFNINGSVGYNKVKNVFNSIRTLLDSGKTQTTYQNISNQDEYVASIWTGITVTRKFKLNISAGYNYTSYSSVEKALYLYHNGGTFYTTFNYSYAPDNLTIIEANNRYGIYASPQGSSRSNINMGLSVQRKFFSKRVMVSLAAIDPFGIQKYHNFTYAPNFNIESYSESNTRNFRLTLSYQISKTLMKSDLDNKDKQKALDRLIRK
jgi:hypothetical protein